MIRKVMSLKSWIKSSYISEGIITSSNEEFNKFESNMVVGIRKLGNPTWETAKSKVIEKQIAGSCILTLHLQAKNSDLWDNVCIFVKLFTRTDCNDQLHKTQFRNITTQFIAVYHTQPAQQLVMLCGYAIVGGRCDIVTSIFANKGCW
jgi:chloramphenicol O-acetyltransferase